MRTPVPRAVALLFAVVLLAAGRAAADEGEGEPRYAGRPAAWWVEELRHRDRAPAAHVAFREIGPSSLVVLARALDDPDRAFRERVMRAMRYVPGDASAVLSRVLEAVDDDHPPVRQEALHLLRQMGEAAAPAVPLLVERLGVTSWGHAYMAMEILDGLGERAAAAEDVLIERLAVGRDVERRRAMRALPKVAPRSARVAAALVPLYDDPDERTRVEVVRGLADLDPTLAGVTGTLCVAVRDPSPTVRRHAAEALAARVTGDAQALEALLLALGDPEDDVVSAALKALEPAGARAAPAVAALVRILESDRERLHHAAAGLLQGIGGAAAPAIPALVQRLGKVHQAAGALAALLPQSLPALLEAVASPDPVRRVAAYEVVDRVPTEMLAAHGEALAAALASFLRGSFPQRYLLERALGLLVRVSPASPEALTLLLSLHADPDATLRHNLVIKLAQLPEAGPAILEMLGSADVSERDLAFRVLYQTRHTEDLVAPVAALLVHPEEDVRSRAAEALLVGASPARIRLDLPPRAPRALDRRQRQALARVLTAWLASSERARRQHAHYALPQLEGDGLVAWDALLDALADEDAQLALQAGHALARLAGHRPASPVPALLAWMDEAPPAQAAGLAFVLAHLDAPPRRLLAHLGLWLALEDASVHQKALAAVRRMGPAATPLVPDLVAFVRRRPGPALSEAALALGQIAPHDPAAFECLVDLLNDRDEPARRFAASALHLVGEAAVGALAATLDDPDADFVAIVVMSLANLREAATSARKRIAALADHPDENVRRAVQAALASIP